VKASQTKSQRLAVALDELAFLFPGCVDVVMVNSYHWIDRMVHRVSGQDLPYTRQMQDNPRTRLWSSHAISENDVSVLLFSKEARPLCSFSLSGSYNRNVSAMSRAIAEQVKDLLVFYDEVLSLSTKQTTTGEVRPQIQLPS
jgi:hypothetical protein